MALLTQIIVSVGDIKLTVEVLGVRYG